MKLDKLENLSLILFGGLVILGAVFFIITSQVTYIIFICFSFCFMMFVPLVLRFATLKYFLAVKHPELLDFKNLDFDKLAREYKQKRDSK